MELKNCPFCGGEAEIKQTGPKKVKIRCSKCHMGIEQKVLKLSVEWLQQKLFEDWNNRIYEQSL